MTHTSDKLREELERWATNFILEANIAHLTEDGGNSFKSELMDYLVEKLVVKLETTLKDREERIRNMLIIHGYGPELRDAEAKEAQEDAYRSLHTDTNSDEK